MPVAGPAGTPGDARVYFEGSVSKVVLLKPAVTAFFALVLALALVVLLKGKSREMAAWFSGALVLAGLGYFFVCHLAWKSNVFRVTADRVECETGLLSKKIVNIDMWRVRDIRYEQTLGQKMMGVGQVSVHTAERPDAPLIIGPIKEARALYDVLKGAQLDADRRRGVVRIES